VKAPNQTILNILVFITSFSILGYEINFTRIFAFTQWHNLSALIITMALLGFGTSGSIIAMIQQKIETDFSRYLFVAAMLFPLFLCTGFIVSSKLDFNPYEITFSLKQVFHLFLYFFFMGISFLFGAVIICIAFLKRKISFIYFVNLSGSAAGVVFVLLLSFLLHPYDITALIIIISLFPLCLLASQGNIKVITGSALVVFLTFTALFLFFSSPDAKHVSQYKPISGALNLPKAKLVHEAYSPLGVVQVVEANGLRSTAGLSLASPFQVPIQKAIFFNGEGASPITPYTGNPEEIRYVQYLTSYLPFHIIAPKNRNHALIIGSGGGESILRSILASFKKIDALEADQNVIHLMRHNFAPFSGGIYNLDKVEVLNLEARNFVRQTQKKYDLIELSMIDTYNAAASGVYALNESYLYTVEAVKDYFNHLDDNGVLAITRWMVTPARDNLKLFNIVITALNSMGIDNSGDHLIAIRSLQTLTLVVLKKGASTDMVKQTKSFAQERLFDLVYYPGISKKEANQYIRLKTPVYYQGLTNLLSDKTRSFVDQYDFDITAATDNRPYFYNFFKPEMIGLIRTYGPSQVPITEWGYLLLLIILVPVLLISILFILAPLLVIKNHPKKMNFATLLYFSLIGVGFFFIEMPLIQKMILFLGHPVYSISVIISALLIFSGIGSYFSDRLFKNKYRIFISTILITLFTCIYILTMDNLFQELISLSFGTRLFIVIFLTAPLGFFMGIPFPAGLDILKEQDKFSIPWAWGINGYFSVISILLATLLAIIFGFRPVLTVAVLCYLTAGIVSFRLR